MDLIDLNIETDALRSEDRPINVLSGTTWSGLLHVAEWAVVALLLLSLVNGGVLPGWSSLWSEFPN